ncbi:TasA family protein [Thermococcus sp.]|uniref:TasA family protein n=1 Tax=Thermococcus sp. TaxID=35749 RepID=UPI002608ECDE|nr:TasA family protein [Thermococcus sp.]
MKRWSIVAVGGLLALLLLGSASPFFTDVAKSKGNEISSGKFDIAISREGTRYYNDLKLFQFSGMKPGDERTFEFYVKNRGDIAVSKLILVFRVSDREVGEMSPAEKEVDNTTETGELSKCLIVKSIEVYRGNSSYAINGVSGKTLREISGEGLELLREQLAEGENIRVAVAVEFSPSAGNECQTDSVKVDMELTAEQ